MKDKILKLRKEGKSYNEIQAILGCSKGTISYYCSDNQKDKALKRQAKRRRNFLIKKLDNFRYKNIKEGVRKFQKTEYLNGKRQINKEINIV